MRTLLSALILSLGAIVSAQAEELSAATGANIKLGPVNGVAYYTVAEDGYRVVATLASGERGVPIRIRTTLAPAQRMSFSVPGEANDADVALELVREGDRVLLLASKAQF
jgi:predicted aconitase